MPLNFDPYAITDSDIAHMIFQDFNFPVIDQFGTLRWYTSADIGSGKSCTGLLEDEKFANVIKQSSGPAFIIERSYGGTHLKKSTLMGKHFFESLQSPSLTGTPMDYLPSEEHLVLKKVANAQNLGFVSFTQNPLAPVNAQGLLEADVANGYIIRVREALQLPSIQSRIETRKKQFHGRSNKIQRNLDRLQLILECPHIVEVRLSYLGGNRPFSLNDTVAHIKHLFADPQESIAHMPVWQFWKRQHTSEAGFNYRCVLVYDTPYIDQVQMSTNDLCVLWQKLTDGRGVAMLSQDFGADFKAAKRHAKLMFRRDLTLQLQESPETQHFGMSDITAITKDTPNHSAVTFEPFGPVSHLI